MEAAIGWTIFRLTVWAMIALWVNPRLLDLVGGQSIASWLLNHHWVRVLSVPPLGLLALISLFEINDPRKRAARQELASNMGATLVEPGGIDPTTFGIPNGPGLRVPLGRWSMVVNSWKSKGKAHTVASVQVKTQSTFSFVARGTEREPKMMRGLQQLAVGYSVRHMAEHSSDPRAAAAAATLAYLAEPPIATGYDELDRAVVLRANQPDTARALLTTSATASAIAALDAKTRRWDLTFYPAATAGTAEMRLECPGALNDADTLRVVQELMRATLEEMARAGAIAG